MKPGFSCLILFWFWFVLVIFPVYAQQIPTVPKAPPVSIKQLKQSISENDRIEWITLRLEKNHPPNQPIQRIRMAVEGRTTLILHPLQRHLPFETTPLTQYPFFHLEMCSMAPEMNLESRFRWRDFIHSGGTLFMDTCPDSRTMEEQKAFNQSWKDWGRSIFPGSGWSPLNRKHTLSFSFYLLEKRMLLQNEGSPFSMLELDGRVILLHNQSPRWSWHTLKSSPVSAQLNPRNIEIHLRLYINLMMLFLSGDYKQDQLHLPTILLRRR